MVLFIRLIDLYRVCGRAFFICIFALSLSACVADDFSFPNLDFQPQYSTVSSGGSGSEEGGQPNPRRHIPSEDLLESGDALKLVEQGREYDPARAHLEARKKVNTKRRRTDKELAAHFKPDAKSGRDETFRVLRIQGSSSKDRYKNVEVSGHAVSTPKGKISEKGGFSNRLSRLFDTNDAGGDVIVPRKKPVVPVRYRRNDSSLAAVAAEISTADDVVVPPSLPERKRVRSVVAPISDKSDVIVPRRKPVVRSSKGSQSSVHVIERGTQSDKHASVLHVRSGVHSGKSRFVMELDNPTRYKIAIDPLRNVLRIKLEHSYLRVEPNGVLTGTPLLGSYVARAQQDGSVLIEVRLKKKSKILETMQLRPNDVARHRIVIDLQN